LGQHLGHDRVRALAEVDAPERGEDGMPSSSTMGSLCDIGFSLWSVRAKLPQGLGPNKKPARLDLAGVGAQHSRIGKP
jgi:hypothetical protein